MSIARALTFAAFLSFPTLLVAQSPDSALRDGPRRSRR
jgi:hypothetical protein